MFANITTISKPSVYCRMLPSPRYLPQSRVYQPPFSLASFPEDADIALYSKYLLRVHITPDIQFPITCQTML